MATQKPISTISYNSESFLKEKLDSWYKAHIIQAYQFIKHKGEDGDKDHIHLRIEPNKKLDPMILADELLEYPAGTDKPLGCRPFRPSKEEPWILYAVHDADFLRLKYGGGEKGEKIPYEWTDIVVSPYYDMEVAFIRAKASMNHSSVSIASRLQNGANPVDLILEGENTFVVSSINRALYGNDYQRVVKELDRVTDKLNRLEDAIERANLSIELDENDILVLVPISQVEEPIF